MHRLRPVAEGSDVERASFFFMPRRNPFGYQLATAITAAFFVVLAACSGPASEPVPAAVASQPVASSLSNRPAVPAAGAPVWHYEGAEGPANWGKLSPSFAACGDGQRQSPIDISKPMRGTTPEMKTAFLPAALRIAHHEHIADGINNGHTIQINYPEADTLTLGSVSYQLVQYHFHSPSEHTVDGKSFPMEMHMVHKSGGGALAVVGVLIEEGAHNPAFAPVFTNLPAQKGVETHFPAVNVDVDALLPAARTSFRYDGSLTTPPCSEDVSWIVMTMPIQLSKEQIGAFTRLIKDNNRPVQKLNGRTVLIDTISWAGTNTLHLTS
jgi:carbonic anhydrase